MDNMYSYIGLRHDAIEWVRTTETLEGAISRRLLSIEQHKVDKDLIQEKVDEILAKISGEKPIDGLDLLALLDLGVTTGNEEMKMAIENKKKNILTAGDASAIDLAALYAAENGKDEEIAKRLSRFVSEDTSWANPYAGCPWWTSPWCRRCRARWRVRRTPPARSSVRPECGPRRDP